MADATMNPALAAAILRSAQNLQVHPLDLATAISYETGGTFDPWKAGPTTQWGQHRGLIQWGEPQAKQYGVTKDSSIEDQMSAVERYLTDRGMKPGSNLMDIYSTINAGAPGLYNRSDAANGGAPGTVADKVNNQMGGHVQNARALLGQAGMLPSTPVQSASAAPAASPAAPVAPPSPAPADDAGMMSSLQSIAKMLQPQQVQAPEAPRLDFSPTPAMLRARQLALAMQQQQGQT